MNRNELNGIYKCLETKMRRLFDLLNMRFVCTVGYYNGHYYKNSSGEYEMDYFPIPVISVENLCDIEIDLDFISVTSKLNRNMAIEYDYTKLDKYEFEAYGVDNYLTDLYAKGNTYTEFVDSIQKSSETDIGFSFLFKKDYDFQDIYTLIELINEEEFHY